VLQAVSASTWAIGAIIFVLPSWPGLQSTTAGGRRLRRFDRGPRSETADCEQSLADGRVRRPSITTAPLRDHIGRRRDAFLFLRA
jgi:hypothetical protein